MSNARYESLRLPIHLHAVVPAMALPLHSLQAVKRLQYMLPCSLTAAQRHRCLPTMPLNPFKPMHFTQADMMEEMRRNVKNARLVVKNLFNQYDLHTTGCVSGEQFLRVVSCHGLLSADKVSQASMSTVWNPCCVADVHTRSVMAP